MKLEVTRFDHGKYETVITRDDGASYRLKGVAHMFAIPHDLAHFLVEQRLRLRGRLARPGRQRSFSDAEISEVYAAYREMLSTWAKLPVGGTMELRW